VLDTHVLVWWVSGIAKLSPKALKANKIPHTGSTKEKINDFTGAIFRASWC